MTEREMRDVVERVLRKVVAPAAFGVGLLLAPGCGDDAVALYAAPSVDMKAEGPMAKYMAPFDGSVIKDKGTPAEGAVTKYMAPFDGAVTNDKASVSEGAVTKYMAPFDGGKDFGAVPLYMAPTPDDVG